MEKKIEIRMKPNSKEQKIRQINDNLYEVCVKSKAEKGKANKELLKLLSENFNVHQNQIRILKGLKSRNKIIKITL